jgi:hypothetical protein
MPTTYAELEKAALENERLVQDYETKAVTIFSGIHQGIAKRLELPAEQANKICKLGEPSLAGMKMSREELEAYRRPASRCLEIDDNTGWFQIALLLIIGRHEFRVHLAKMGLKLSINKESWSFDAVSLPNPIVIPLLPTDEQVNQLADVVLESVHGYYANQLDHWLKQTENVAQRLPSTR